MAVLSSRAHEQRSCEIRDRHAFQVAPAPISSRFLCPRPPLLLSAPNQNRHATQASLTWFQAFTHGEKYTEEKNEGGEAALWYLAPLSTTVSKQSERLHHLKSLCSMAPRRFVGRSFTALVCFGLFVRPTKTAMLRRLLGSLSKGVFERLTSTGSKAFSLLICLDDIKFVLHNFFTLIETIWLKIWAIPKMKKGQFRLTCVAQKRRCLNDWNRLNQSSKNIYEGLWLVHFSASTCGSDPLHHPLVAFRAPFSLPRTHYSGTSI